MTSRAKEAETVRDWFIDNVWFIDTVSEEDVLDAETVRGWFTHTVSEEAAHDAEQVFPESVAERLAKKWPDLDIDYVLGDQALRWGGALWSLAGEFSKFVELDAWEYASSKKRKADTRKAIKHALELAKLFISSPWLDYPSALALLDEECAHAIIKALPPDLAEKLLRYITRDPPNYKNERLINLTLFCPTDVLFGTLDISLDRCGKPHLPLSAAEVLACYFPKQAMASSLLRWAKRALKEVNAPQRDPRPHTPTPMHANARVFAQQLDRYFKWRYKRTPNEVIAACVALRFPDLYPKPGGEDVRTWRGAR
jgi:hypothetical protein